MNQSIKFIIDRSTIKKYNLYYFTQYPRRKKEPIVSPIAPSLNQWGIMKRPQANHLKQCWKDFIVWLVQDYNLSNKKIDKCQIVVTYYFRTKQRRDADNYTIKFIGDGLVASGLLEDDDFSHIESLTIMGGYDKNCPRTELTITY